MPAMTPGMAVLIVCVTLTTAFAAPIKCSSSVVLWYDRVRAVAARKLMPPTGGGLPIAVGLAFVLVARPGSAQQQLPPQKPDQTIHFPHVPVQYLNGDSIVRLNIALDEFQVESRGSAPVNANALGALGSVSRISD